MNGWNEVLTLANNGELLWILLPCALEMVIKDGFTETVEDTSRDDIGLHAFFLEVENAVLNLLDLGVLSASLSLLIVPFSEWVMDISLPLWAFHFNCSFFILF